MAPPNFKVLRKWSGSELPGEQHGATIHWDYLVPFLPGVFLCFYAHTCVPTENTERRM